MIATHLPSQPEPFRPVYDASPFEHHENVLAFPQQHRDESWPEYVGRVQLWDRERTEKARASGAYSAVPYVPGLDPVARGLFVSLAWHSYSEGLASTHRLGSPSARSPRSWATRAHMRRVEPALS